MRLLLYLKKINYIIILINILFIDLTNAANILVLEGVPSPSHHIWIRTLTTELATRGHNVTSISADIDNEQIPNLHYIHLEQVYSIIYNSTDEFDYMKIGNIDTWSALFVFNSFCQISCRGSLESKGLQVLLNYPNDFIFDLVLYDYVAQPCLLGLIHKFKYPPLLALTAFGGIGSTAALVGTSFHSHAPYFFNRDYDTTFVYRVNNYVLFLVDSFLKQNILYPKMDEMAAPYYPGSPKMSELEKLTQLVLINTHEVMEIVEPILPNIIPVGGMQIRDAKQLPDDLKLIADSAKNSLILFSLGTNMRSDQLDDEILIKILEVFRNLPQYTFIWKYESKSLPVSIPQNVHIRAWLPQVDILSHPNTILFITHVGLLSSQEAVWYGVPILGLPVFGDQFLNIKKYIKLEIAETVSIQNLKQNEFRNGILKVTENPKYRENIQRRSKLFQDQPETPLERAVFWTEWLIRNKKANFFESPLKPLNTLQRQDIDVVLFLLFTLVLILITIFKSIYIIINCFRGKNNVTKTYIKSKTN